MGQQIFKQLFNLQHVFLCFIHSFDILSSFPAYLTSFKCIHPLCDVTQAGVVVLSYDLKEESICLCPPRQLLHEREKCGPGIGTD